MPDEGHDLMTAYLPWTNAVFRYGGVVKG